MAALLMFLLYSSVFAAEDNSAAFTAEYEAVAIISATDTSLISIAVVISPTWVLTTAHHLPDDTYGLNASDFNVVCFSPKTVYTVDLILTHPTYKPGLVSSEDLALLRLTNRSVVLATSVALQRFPWAQRQCLFIYLAPGLESRYMVMSSSCNVMRMSFCPTLKKNNLVEHWYSHLCSISTMNHSVGNTGGILLCDGALRGFLIEKAWDPENPASFSDISTQSKWIRSRVKDFVTRNFEIRRQSIGLSCALRQHFKSSMLLLFILFLFYLFVVSY